MPKNEQVIRHAYENTLTASARLASFASGKPTMSKDGLIDMRQEVLVADDLLLFAINARRLIETTVSPGHFDNILADVAVYKTSIAQSKTLWFIINKIIHHQDIDILRWDYQISCDFSLDALKNAKAFSPVIIVKSDHGDPFAFKLLDIIIRFESGILNEIVEICAEKHIYLDQDI